MKTEGVYTTINTTTHNPFIDIMVDLFESGNITQLRQIALLHGVYHVYGEVIEELLAAGRYDEAQELLLDLVVGPFYERFSMHAMMNLSQEYTLIPRILFLISLMSKDSLTPHARHLIELVSPSLSFQKFAQRAAQKESQSLSKELIAYAQALCAYLDEQVSVCSCKHVHETPNPFHSKELRWYELFEKIHASKEPTPITSTTLTALRNIIDYTQGRKNKLYEKTLLKLDAQEIYNHAPTDEARSVLAKAGVFDFHLGLSLRLYTEGKYDEAYDVIYEMCHESVVLRSSLEYYKMLTRSLVLDYINLVTPHVSYESAYAMRSLLALAVTQEELEKFSYVMQTGICHNSHILKDFETVAAYVAHHSSLQYHSYVSHQSN
ncbi:hypothetical protein IT409_00585 [Candidatus Falkowbacteria bacterium]|nr:hypothetical protein [Candidatus Falkowbacteria bacterium]